MEKRVEAMKEMFEAIFMLSDELRLSGDRESEAYNALRSQLTRTSLALENLSWLADMDTGKIAERWEKKVNVSRQITACLGSRNQMIKARNLHIKTDMEDVEIAANPDLTRVIWLNLLDNAVKYTEPDGHIDIMVRRAGKWAEAVFQDDGCGIDVDFIPHMFERYAHSDDEPEKNGLGIGLAVVREAVIRLGGQVECVSSPGSGTTARVLLPAG